MLLLLIIIIIIMDAFGKCAFLLLKLKSIFERQPFFFFLGFDNLTPNRVNKYRLDVSLKLFEEIPEPKFLSPKLIKKGLSRMCKVENLIFRYLC